MRFAFTTPLPITLTNLGNLEADLQAAYPTLRLTAHESRDFLYVDQDRAQDFTAPERVAITAAVAAHTGATTAGQVAQANAKLEGRTTGPLADAATAFLAGTGAIGDNQLRRMVASLYLRARAQDLAAGQP